MACKIHVLALLHMTMCNCLKISMIKIFISFLTLSRVSFFCSKKEFSIEPHVWSIKMIKLGNYFFLNIDYSASFVRRNSSWGKKLTEMEVFEKIWNYFSLTSALCPWNYLYIWNFIPSSSILWKVRKTRGYKGCHAKNLWLVARFKNWSTASS